MRPGTHSIEAHPGNVGVCQLTAAHMREELFERHRHNFAELVLVQTLPTHLSAACGQDRISSVSGIAGEPRLADQRQVGCYEARLLGELPGGGLDDIFTLIDHPARQLQQDSTGPGRNCLASTTRSSSVIATTATVPPPTKTSQSVWRSSGMTKVWV